MVYAKYILAEHRITLRRIMVLGFPSAIRHLVTYGCLYILKVPTRRSETAVVNTSAILHSLLFMNIRNFHVLSTGSFCA